jgi:hypothetical protein
MRPVELLGCSPAHAVPWAAKADGEPMAMGDDLEPEAREIPAE